MSTSSYVPVRFTGGPKGGTSGQFAGEPKREWTPKRGGGTYSFEWDRGSDGTKLRSGVYTWSEGDGAPTDGDGASAALEQAGPEQPAQDAPAESKGSAKPSAKPSSRTTK